MAVGDKFFTVMKNELAVSNGVATLGPDGLLNASQRPITDSMPTQGSSNPVQSGGVFSALSNKADRKLSNLETPQLALANLGAGVRPNLLDNAVFIGGGSQQGGGQLPVNQRGQTSYNTAGYSIDRWINTGGTVSLTGDGIGLSGGSINQELYQSLESTDVKGKTCTISALLSTGLAQGTFVFPTEIGDNVVAFDDHEKFALIARVMNTGLPACSLWTYRGKTNTVLSAKLELGPTQTLAYQDEDGNWQLFETPDYGEELVKSQRYYLPIDNRGRFPAVFDSPSTILQVFVPTPVTMRVNPTVQGITRVSARVYSGAANSQSLSVSQTLLTEAGVLINFSATWPTTLNPYSCAIAVFGGDGALSAEL